MSENPLTLCLMVRNEALNIVKCLESVLGIADNIYIMDTGSTDDTLKLASAWLSKHFQTSSFIVETHIWENFALNRTLCLERVRKAFPSGYTLFLDADDTLFVNKKINSKKNWKADGYNIQIKDKSLSYYRLAITKNSKKFKYCGVVHEFPVAPNDAQYIYNCDDFSIIRGAGGYRSSNPNKYLDDAQTIIEALRTESDVNMIARYTFYLAQSYKDAGDSSNAQRYYAQRANMASGWSSEKYVAQFEMSKLTEDAGNVSDGDIVFNYLKAFSMDRSRAEPIHAILRFLRSKNELALGYAITKNIPMLFKKPTTLFIHDWIYDYGLSDELSIAAYWSGDYTLSNKLTSALLKKLDSIPKEDRDRIIRNHKFSKEKL
jgi:glycosyltransferase involved in cell wall biosynthesis